MIVSEDCDADSKKTVAPANPEYFSIFSGGSAKDSQTAPHMQSERARRTVCGSVEEYRTMATRKAS